MISTVLTTFRDTIKDHLYQAGGEKVKVEFIKNKSEGQLVDDAINVILFTSTEMKDLMGTSSFGTPTTGNNAMQQKPPLKLSLNVLLIFNLNEYINALDCYGQVLGYFYNNESLNVDFDGYNNQVMVLFSEFRDLEEIQIQNNFNRPGTPLQRYELNYALIQGAVKELPVIKKVELVSSKAHLGTRGLDPIIVNEIYNPIQDILNSITSATTTFCSIGFNQGEDGLNKMIKERFEDLKTTYQKALDKVNDFKNELEKKIKDDSLNNKVYEPFIPSINALLSLMKEYRDNLINLGEATQENYDQFCKITRSQVEGKEGLHTFFLLKLDVTTHFQQITKTIMLQVDLFKTVGHSIYIETKPDLFKTRGDLSLLQKQTKWWELEDELSELEATYTEQIEEYLSNPQKDDNVQAYNIFRKQLDSYKQKLKEPLAVVTKLNKNYNHIEVEDSDKTRDEDNPVYEKLYQENYSESHKAVTTPNDDDKDISALLADDLQQFLQSIINN